MDVAAPTWGECDICHRIRLVEPYPIWDAYVRCCECWRNKAEDMGSKTAKRHRKRCPTWLDCDWAQRDAGGLLPVHVSLVNEGAIVRGSPDRIDELIARIHEVSLSTGLTYWEVVSRALVNYLYGVDTHDVPESNDRETHGNGRTGEEGPTGDDGPPRFGWLTIAAAPIPVTP